MVGGGEGGGVRGGGGRAVRLELATALTLLRKASLDGAATMVAGSTFHEIMVLGRKE